MTPTRLRRNSALGRIRPLEKTGSRESAPLLDFHTAECWCWEYWATANNGKHKFIKGYRQSRVNGIGFAIWKRIPLVREQFTEGPFSDLNNKYYVICRMTNLPPAFAWSNHVNRDDTLYKRGLHVPLLPDCSTCQGVWADFGKGCGAQTVNRITVQISSKRF